MPDVQLIRKLRRFATRIRIDIVEMIGCEGQAGHLGGSCSSADVIATLYGHKMTHRPDEPGYPLRDKFLYSKGHAAIAQYAALAEQGYFPKDELKTLKRLGSMLQGHPDRLKTPGVEAGTGSLGQGLSIANGLALAMRLDGTGKRVYCLMGDGELAEGQIWEAAMASVNFRLDNLVGIVDKNRMQATGFVSDRFATDPLKDKWEGFGWHVIEVDGHDIGALINAFNAAETVKGRPTALITDTVKGKGVAFAENQAAFHNGTLTPQQYDEALRVLYAQLAELEDER